MYTLFHNIIRRHRKQAYLAVLLASQHDHAAAQLIFQLVAQCAHCVCVHILYFRSQNRYAADLNLLIQHFLRCAACHFCFQLLQFLRQLLLLCQKLLDPVH